MNKNRLQDLLMETRAVPVTPTSYDENTHSVKAVALTETKVRVWDWERWDVIDEIILMNGVELPEGDQVPVVDSHNYSSITNLLGSAREFSKSIETLDCRLFFSSVQKAQDAETQAKEGHLNRVSSGYNVLESVWVESNTTANVNGRNFSGPVKVVTKCRLKEVSPVILPADENSAIRTLRSQPNIMNELIAAGMSPNSTNEEIRNFVKQQFNPQTTRKDQQIMDEELKKLREQVEKSEARLATLETENKTAKTDADKAKKRAEDVKEIASIAARYAETPGVIDLAQKAIDDEKMSVQQFTLDVLEKVRTAPVKIPGKEQRIDGGGVVLLGDTTKPWERRTVQYMKALVLEKKGHREQANQILASLETSYKEMSQIQKDDELREAAQTIISAPISNLQKKRLMSTLSTGAGGAAKVPAPLLAEIFVLVEQWGVARRYFRQIPMIADELKLTSIATKAAAYWVAQAGRITLSDLGFTSGSLTTYKLAGLAAWTHELNEDQAIALLPVIIDSFAEAISKEEDLAAFIGDGTATYGGFTGWINDVGTVVTMVAGKTAFLNANADDYRALRDAVRKSHRRGAAYFLSPESVSGLEGLKDLQGNYIYRAPSGELPAMLWGYPIADNDGIEVLSEIESAVSTRFAIFGNPKHRLMGVKREQDIAISQDAVIQAADNSILVNLFQSDAEAVRITERIGFKGVNQASSAALRTAAA
jgi:HK97 family phage major capsid protein